MGTRWSWLPLGLAGGALLGVVARVWMRVISTDPGFTWSGTLFIVGGFAVFGLSQSIAAVVRATAVHRWPVAVARGVGVVGMLPLFVAAGAVMAPTVIAGGLCRARTDWPVALRAVTGLIALAPVVLVGWQLVDELGISVRLLVGLIGLVAAYATIVLATRPTMAPPATPARTSPRRHAAVLAALGVVVIATVMASTGLG